MQLRNLSLLQEKITELRSALLFCENPHDLPYASYLLEVTAMDETGCISFYINKHTGHAVSYGELFPVRMEFYRKGIPYSIDIKGMAGIEEDSTDNRLLVKVRIGKLRYNEIITPALQPLEAIGKVVKSIFDIPEPMDAYLQTEL